MTVIERLYRPTSIVPLVVFRLAFGLLMFGGTVRFIASGWIEEFYLRPTFHFTYYGFGWVKPLPGLWLYLVYGAIALLALNIAAGLFYRPSIILFFLLFSYTELLDKTYYLNHYYFISVLSFLLIFLPLHRKFSLDVWRRPDLKTETVPRWTVAAIQLQVGLVYFFAGLAKLEYDWLFRAMPLKIWLAGRTSLPLIGGLFDAPWVAFLLSWAGAVYDLTIVFFLRYRPTRLPAYLAVIGFHLMTALLFNIGMFPYIMIACTLIFFSAGELRQATYFVLRLASFVRRSSPAQNRTRIERITTDQKMKKESVGIWAIQTIRVPLFAGLVQTCLRALGVSARDFGCGFTTSLNTRYALRTTHYDSPPHPALLTLLTLFFTAQLLLPLRHWLYPGDVLWTEEGFRFAWKVMLVEKTGFVTFEVTEPASGRRWTVYPADYLTTQQEKQMAFQPDMILEFAHYLAQDLKAHGLGSVEVRAEAYVSLNGRPSHLLLDPTVDLVRQTNSLAPKEWIIR